MLADIKSMTQKELEDWIIARGEKPYRARQIYGWLHEKLACSWDEMTTLPGSMREALHDEPLTVLQKEECQISALDGTRKYLFSLPDGNVIESVLMRYRHGNSVCISSQAGCRMGCAFCASAIGGKKRDLLPSEMLDQIYRIRTDTGERVSNVVVMGTGEPLDNYENLLRFVQLLTGEGGLHISQRNVTVSTCGLVPKIYELARQKLSITLALSLHAPDDDIRRRLMPVARKYTIEETLKACRYYFVETGRRVTFEYSLIHGVNDAREHAQKLGGLLAGMHGHVNLIPVNSVRERSFVHPDPYIISNFKNELEKYGINVTIRREMGADIDGACGQLRSKFRKREQT